MRPQSIVLFDRLFLASLVIGLINAILTYDSVVAATAGDPTLQQIGWGGGAVIVVMAISLLIPLLLWYLIAWRASNIAKWVLVVMTAIGLFFIGFDPDNLTSLSNLASLATTLLQVVAIVMLFRADARAWLEGDAQPPHHPE